MIKHPNKSLHIDQNRHFATPIICLFFFASGFSALIYQVAWVRMFSVSFGTTIYAISTVLCVFMAGLALGSFLIGQWADRCRNPLMVYGVLEFVLAVYVILLTFWMPWLHEFTTGILTGRELTHTSTSLIKFIIATVALLPPTSLMGGTLPLLAKFVNRSSQTTGKWMGLLYGLNTLGAVLGSLAAAYVLILHLGVNGTLYLAATLTAFVGLASCVLAAWWPGRESSQPGRETHRKIPVREGDIQGVDLPSAIPGSRLTFVHLVAFSSGFITLAAEVFWVRLLTNFLSANVLVFATILGAFLLGIALGSLLVSRWVDRLRSLDMALFVALLASALLLVLSSLGQVVLGGIFQEIRELESLSLPGKVNLTLLFMFLIVAVPATVFGTVLPILFRWCSRSVTSIGRDIGRLYASNTVGSIFGSFISGFIMIPLLGLNTSLLILGLLYLVLAIIAVTRTANRAIAGLLAVTVVTLLFIPSIRKPVYWYNGGFTQVRTVPPEQTVYLNEGTEGTVGIIDSGNFLALTSNGVIVAESTLHDLWDLLLKAHLPMLLQEDPRKVALVGLGAGVSLGAVASYEQPEQIDVIEISKEIVPAHKLFAAVNDRAWEDPRVNIWINDGRHFLLTTENRYDVISVDPTDPPVVYQYTQDFMQLCYDRLNDGGLMVQWVPLFHLSSEHLRIIIKGFQNVFKHSTIWYDGTSILLMGQRGGALSIDLERMRARLGQPRVQANLAKIGNPDEWLLLATYLGDSQVINRLVGGNVPANTDDMPYLEYAILRSEAVTARTLADNLAMLWSHDESVLPRLADNNLDPADILELHRQETIIKQLLNYRVQKMLGQKEESVATLRTLVKKVQMDEDELKSLWPFYR